MQAAPDGTVPVESDFDAMVRGGEVVLAHAVAHALVHDLADGVEAQAHHHVARPAAALARLRQILLGVEHAAPALGIDVTAEVAVVAEQPEPVHHLPGDDDAGRRLHRRFGRRLDGRRRIGSGVWVWARTMPFAPAKRATIATRGGGKGDGQREGEGASIRRDPSDEFPSRRSFERAHGDIRAAA